MLNKLWTLILNQPQRHRLIACVPRPLVGHPLLCNARGLQDCECVELTGRIYVFALYAYEIR